MKDFSNDTFIHLPVPASMYAAVCAVIAGGVSIPALASSGAGGKPAAAPVAEPAPNAVSGVAASSSGDTVGAASVDASELDTGGHPWSDALHASTKNKTKDGYWRMKVGVARPANLPGFPKADGTTSTASTGEASQTPATAPTADAGAAEDDEFAAFRTAAAAGQATDAAAAGNVPARKWTDADLSALCNQAATKLNDPKPIKDLISEYVPEGAVAHSRNIEDDQRENFAKALEAKAGITFAG